MDDIQYLDLTPDPRVLNMLGEIPLKGHQCIAELIDNSIDSSKDSTDEAKINTIKIYLPSDKELKQGIDLTITDSGKGMTARELNNAIRAGYSGKGSQDNLGLFGMGFNIATARLGTIATVWTSTVNDDKEYGVVIDLLKMQNERSFKAQLLDGHNSIFSSRGKSGTKISIAKYKPEGIRLLSNRMEIIRRLKSVYSQSLFNKYNIELTINSERIDGKKFCIWNHDKGDRHATYKGIPYPPYVKVLEKILHSVPYCENCLNELAWIGKDNKVLPAICDFCGQEGSIFKKDYLISGWLGIQRFFSQNDYGIDIVRNGRIIEEYVKEIFYWTPRDSYNLDEDKLDLLGREGKLLEYPIDNRSLGGRIVGEIYADFIKPTYTKDSFERTELWYDAMEKFRGRSPLQIDWATSRMGMEKNESPLSLLYHAYRRTEPGAANLVCGAPQGGASQGNKMALQYYDKFIEGDPDYQDDDKWYELVIKAESRTDIDEIEDIPQAGQVKEGPSEKIQEPYPGQKKILSNITIDLERLIDIPKKDVTVFEWMPDRIEPKPIIFIGISVSEWHFLINYNHDMIRDFPEGWEDLLLIEIAHRFASKIDNPFDWSITTIYYELKKKYFPERILNIDNIFLGANNLIKDIIAYLVNKKFPLEEKPELNDKQIGIIRKNYMQVENKEIKQTSELVGDTSFLMYVDKNYIFDFIKSYPFLLFDGHFFDLPYSSIDDEDLRASRLKSYMGYFADIDWILSNIPDITNATMRTNKSMIIKANLSLEELSSRRL